MNKFSDKYYLQIQQTFGDLVTGFALPRLATLDDEPELTESDITHAEHHAGLAGKAGAFETGYYDVNLYEYYSTEPVDTEHRVL